MYTKVFSNIANPFKEVDFINDERDPYEELRELPRSQPLKHIIDDFTPELHDIKSSKYQMKQFSI